MQNAYVGASVLLRVSLLQHGADKFSGPCDCFGWLRSLSIYGSIGLLRQLMHASVCASVLLRLRSVQRAADKRPGLCDCFGLLCSLDMWIHWAAALAHACKRVCVALFMNLLLLLGMRPFST